ncbi:MAG TPA: glycosyltransferase family 4 protein, partial [Terriglobales bacterium]|nr:glycosyltransferase family 4 protein [Terriglobales bacterium]
MKTPTPSLLLLALDFPPTTGGIQTLTWEIYSRLADLTRLAVAPALPLDASDGDAGSFPLVRTRRPVGQGWETVHYLREAAGLLQRQRRPPCLLHCNHLFAGYAGWWLRRRWGLPYVVWAHGEEITKSRHPRLLRASLGAAAAIFVNSDYTAARVRERLRPQAPPICKIPLGAAASWWQTPPQAAPAAGPPTILTVARLSQRDRYKGVDTSLAAVAVLRQRGLALRYHIAGDGDDRPRLERLAHQLGIHDAVTFLGRVAPERLLALYDSADVFLLCSREEATPRGVGFEGFGIALLEANARGKPVVAGRSGGIPDAVVDGETGLLVDPLSPAAVADGLQRLLADPALRTKLGAQGRERVRRQFHWEAAADQVRRLHLDLLAGAPPSGPLRGGPAPSKRSADMRPQGPQVGASMPPRASIAGRLTSGTRAAGALGPAPNKRSADLGPWGPRVGASMPPRASTAGRLTSGTRAAGALGPAPTN